MPLLGRIRGLLKSRKDQWNSASESDQSRSLVSESGSYSEDTLSLQTKPSPKPGRVQSSLQRKLTSKLRNRLASSIRRRHVGTSSQDPHEGIPELLSRASFVSAESAESLCLDLQPSCGAQCQEPWQVDESKEHAAYGSTNSRAQSRAVEQQRWAPDSSARAGLDTEEDFQLLYCSDGNEILPSLDDKESPSLIIDADLEDGNHQTANAPAGGTPIVKHEPGAFFSGSEVCENKKQYSSAASTSTWSEKQSPVESLKYRSQVADPKSIVRSLSDNLVFCQLKPDATFYLGSKSSPKVSVQSALALNRDVYKVALSSSGMKSQTESEGSTLDDVSQLQTDLSKAMESRGHITYRNILHSQSSISDNTFRKIPCLAFPHESSDMSDTSNEKCQRFPLDPYQIDKDPCKNKVASAISSLTQRTCYGLHSKPEPVLVDEMTSADVGKGNFESCLPTRKCSMDIMADECRRQVRRESSSDICNEIALVKKNLNPVVTNRHKEYTDIKTNAQEEKTTSARDLFSRRAHSLSPVSEQKIVGKALHVRSHMDSLVPTQLGLMPQETCLKRISCGIGVPSEPIFCKDSTVECDLRKESSFASLVDTTESPNDGHCLCCPLHPINANSVLYGDYLYLLRLHNYYVGRFDPAPASLMGQPRRSQQTADPVLQAQQDLQQRDGGVQTSDIATGRPFCSKKNEAVQAGRRSFCTKNKAVQTRCRQKSEAVVQTSEPELYSETCAVFATSGSRHKTRSEGVQTSAGKSVNSKEAVVWLSKPTDHDVVKAFPHISQNTLRKYYKEDLLRGLKKIESVDKILLRGTSLDFVDVSIAEMDKTESEQAHSLTQRPNDKIMLEKTSPKNTQKTKCENYINSNQLESLSKTINNFSNHTSKLVGMLNNKACKGDTNFGDNECVHGSKHVLTMDSDFQAKVKSLRNSEEDEFSRKSKARSPHTFPKAQIPQCAERSHEHTKEKLRNAKLIAGDSNSVMDKLWSANRSPTTVLNKETKTKTKTDKKQQGLSAAANIHPALLKVSQHRAAIDTLVCSARAAQQERQTNNTSERQRVNWGHYSATQKVSRQLLAKVQATARLLSLGNGMYAVRRRELAPHLHQELMQEERRQSATGRQGARCRDLDLSSVALPESAADMLHDDEGSEHIPLQEESGSWSRNLSSLSESSSKNLLKKRTLQKRSFRSHLSDDVRTNSAPIDLPSELANLLCMHSSAHYRALCKMSKGIIKLLQSIEAKSSQPKSSSSVAISSALFTTKHPRSDSVTDILKLQQKLDSFRKHLLDLIISGSCKKKLKTTNIKNNIMPMTKDIPELTESYCSQEIDTEEGIYKIRNKILKSEHQSVNVLPKDDETKNCKGSTSSHVFYKNTNETIPKLFQAASEQEQTESHGSRVNKSKQIEVISGSSMGQDVEQHILKLKTANNKSFKFLTEEPKEEKKAPATTIMKNSHSLTKRDHQPLSSAHSRLVSQLYECLEDKAQATDRISSGMGDSLGFECLGQKNFKSVTNRKKIRALTSQGIGMQSNRGACPQDSRASTQDSSSQKVDDTLSSDIVGSKVPTVNNDTPILCLLKSLILEVTTSSQSSNKVEAFSSKSEISKSEDDVKPKVCKMPILDSNFLKSMTPGMTWTPDSSECNSVSISKEFIEKAPEALVSNIRQKAAMIRKTLQEVSPSCLERKVHRIQSQPVSLASDSHSYWGDLDTDHGNRSSAPKRNKKFQKTLASVGADYIKIAGKTASDSHFSRGKKTPKALMEVSPAILSEQTNALLYSFPSKKNVPAKGSQNVPADSTSSSSITLQLSQCTKSFSLPANSPILSGSSMKSMKSLSPDRECQGSAEEALSTGKIYNSSDFVSYLTKSSASDCLCSRTESGVLKVKSDRKMPSQSQEKRVEYAIMESELRGNHSDEWPQSAISTTQSSHKQSASHDSGYLSGKKGQIGNQLHPDTPTVFNEKDGNSICKKALVAPSNPSFSPNACFTIKKNINQTKSSDLMLTDCVAQSVNEHLKMARTSESSLLESLSKTPGDSLEQKLSDADKVFLESSKPESVFDAETVETRKSLSLLPNFQRLSETFYDESRFRIKAESVPGRTVPKIKECLSEKVVGKQDSVSKYKEIPANKGWAVAELNTAVSESLLSISERHVALPREDWFQKTEVSYNKEICSPSGKISTASLSSLTEFKFQSNTQSMEWPSLKPSLNGMVEPKTLSPINQKHEASGKIVYSQNEYLRDDYESNVKKIAKFFDKPDHKRVSTNHRDMPQLPCSMLPSRGCSPQKDKPNQFAARSNLTTRVADNVQNQAVSRFRSTSKIPVRYPGFSIGSYNRCQSTSPSGIWRKPNFNVPSLQTSPSPNSVLSAVSLSNTLSPSGVSWSMSPSPEPPRRLSYSSLSPSPIHGRLLSNNLSTFASLSRPPFERNFMSEHVMPASYQRLLSSSSSPRLSRRRVISPEIPTSLPKTQRRKQSLATALQSQSTQCKSALQTADGTKKPIKSTASEKTQSVSPSVPRARSKSPQIARARSKSPQIARARSKSPQIVLSKAPSAVLPVVSLSSKTTARSRLGLRSKPRPTQLRRGPHQDLMKFTSSTSSLESPIESPHCRRTTRSPDLVRDKKSKKKPVKRTGTHWKEARKRSKSRERGKDLRGNQINSSRAGTESSGSLTGRRRFKNGQVKASSTKRGKKDKQVTVVKPTASPRSGRTAIKESSSRKRRERENMSGSSGDSSLSINTRCSRVSQGSGGSTFGNQTYFEPNFGLKTTLLYDFFK